MPRSITKTAIRGISSAVPLHKEGEQELAEVFGERDARRLVKGVGIRERRIAKDLCTSDLCLAAAQKLLKELDWDPSSIDHLVFVTQTADYKIPASACIIQQRLGLSSHCSAFDINLGCSGYTYGLWIVARLLEPGQRALFLAGDTSSSIICHHDRSAVPLFGDCGTATALEWDDLNDITVVGGTDGAGHQNIIIPAGGLRKRSSAETLEAVLSPDGSMRSAEDVYMNGAEVFGFALREVPALLNECLKFKGWTTEEIDAVVFHQANAFMLSTIANKVGIPLNKVPMSIEMYGNTSSASIPLTMTVCMREQLQKGGAKILLAGFGIGWSWAAVAFQPGSMVMPELVEI